MVIVIVILLLCVIFVVVFLVTRPSSKLGESCLLPIDCQGNTAIGEGVTCDLGVCAQKQKDWAGFWYPASKCKDSPSSAEGSCKTGFSWPRKINEPCNANTDCNGFDIGLGQGTTCDLGKCVDKKQDWAKVWYPPSVCVGESGGKPGTCI